MKIYFEYGRKALAIPAVSRKLMLRAGKTELRLLIALADDAALCEHYEERADALATEFKVTRMALDSALGFWIGAGVISKEKTDDPREERGSLESMFESVSKKPTVTAEESLPKRTRVTELPQYTGEEFTRVLERRGELAGLIEEAQGILGKVFNVTETQCLVSISEGLGLDDEYILSLLAYCKRIDKSNMRYIEKTALSLYDKGIHTAARLEQHLVELDRLASAEGRIRKIFGMGERAFTSKESAFINDWINKYGFDFDMIKLAYEETVNNTSKPSMSYANKVLESWYSEGFKKPTDIEKSKQKRNGTPTGAQATSFNVDDFFNAAINRGFGESDRQE